MREMDGLKQLYLLWTLLSIAAICVLCQQQQLTSTLLEGNYSCQGEEVIFTCTVSDSTLSVLVIGWSSAEYIGPGALLQFTTNDMLGANDTSTIDGNITAFAVLTRSTNDSGVLMVESTLRIVATVPSEVTCEVNNGDRVSSSFSVSAVPGVPQRISAAEISRPRDNICIILVTWDPPANSDPSEIDEYIIYIPSRNIREVSSSTLTTLTVMNCGDDVRIQVAAMNHFGCGMNSSEIQPSPLDDIPTDPAITEGGSATTTEGVSATTSNQLGAGAVAGIAIAVVLVVIVGICILCGFIIYCCFKKKDRATEEERMEMIKFNLQLRQELKELRGSNPKDCLIDLYNIIVLRTPSKKNSVNATPEETSDSVITSAVGALRAVLKKTEAFDIREALKTALVILQGENPDEMRRALDYLMKLIPDNMSNEVKSNLQELRDKTETTLLERALDSMIEKALITPPDKIKKSLLRLCDALFEKLLKLSSPEQETALRKFDIIPFEYFKSLTAKDLESEEEDVQVKMHVYEMPKWTEEGEFLVVDMLDIDHLQVRHISVVEGRIQKKNCEEFKRGEMAAEETAKGLAHFINKCITKFINDKNIGENLPITFTSPFHDTSGKLIRWTREPEGAPEEIKNIEVDVAVAVNDATGILLAMGNKEPDCRIGLSFRDRANACYMEELVAGDCKVINMEWGAFDDDGQLEQWRTDYDGPLDDNPQLFEKMISEEQQGIVVCRVLKHLISKKELFGGRRVTKLDKFEAFCKESLGIIEDWDIETCKRLLKHHFDIEASDRDCVVIQRVCEAVSTHAARLAAAGIVALVKKIDKIDGCTVAVDSFLYIQHPQFPKRIQVALKELESGSNIKIKPIEYGSRQSADFAAAMLQYCVGPPPSSSPGSPSSDAEGFEGPRGQDITGSGTEEPTAAAAVENLNIRDEGRHPHAQALELEVVENQNQ